MVILNNEAKYQQVAEKLIVAAFYERRFPVSA
jgi:hypothetical protein